MRTEDIAQKAGVSRRDLGLFRTDLHLAVDNARKCMILPALDHLIAASYRRMSVWDSISDAALDGKISSAEEKRITDALEKEVTDTGVSVASEARQNCGCQWVH